MTRPVLIVGDSHVDAIKSALAANGAPAGIEAFRLAKMKNGKPFGELPFDDALRRIRTLPRDALVVCAIGGNQHQSIGLVQHRRRFDFALPGESLPDDDSAEIVPFQAMRALFERGLRGGDFAKLRAIRETAPGEVVQLAPPPPKADEDFVRRHIDTVFRDMGFDETGLSEAGLRLRLWRLQLLVTGELCGEIGVELVPNPLAALTPNGFLAPDFYAADATHANAAYGREVLGQIEARRRRTAPAEAGRG
ncbi:hypothetical protein MWN33_10825 [Starkeya koreensis]|uniref:Uncharacterized protein n=1 Tax=Ancylobacter koreensis TaxID=266121 RepID=A0ABT0DMU3_9HYPH|nr:hypothetical protein [Ancylobacter koreensis]MCK0208524.1 hypothetical protein [Ancylobacter koreensis]